MNDPDSTRPTAGFLVRMAAVGLVGIGTVAGCGDGTDRSIKVENGKSIEESITGRPGAVKKHEAAPIQRRKAAG